MPIFSNALPKNPVSEYIFVNVIPATAVGSAKGSSIIPSISRLPGKSYLTSTHARITPKTQLTTAAINAHPILVTKDCTTFGLVIKLRNSCPDKRKEYASTDARGIKMIRDSMATVIPMLSPNPGIMDFFLFACAFFNGTASYLL